MRAAVSSVLSVVLVCGGLWTPVLANPPTESLRPEVRVVVSTQSAGFDRWVEGYKARAQKQGVSRRVLDQAFRGVGYNEEVISKDRNQSEFKREIWDYLDFAASPIRIENGKVALRKYGRTLDQIEAKYGVEKEVVAAVWGMESTYGERRGTFNVIEALASLAYDGRRDAFFEKQLTAALEILQSGDIAPGKMMGSWAGAMGHTQFIPTSYQAYAVDFTGDGRRDIWSEDPSDSMASTAAYLQRHGWTRGLPWGGEVGSGGASGTVIQPQAGGPRFNTTSNFRVIKRYNPSDAYALGVGHLADRIGGAGPLRGSFPPDVNGLTKADRITLQQRLTALGYDTQGADGVIGSNTESAIRAYQSSQGLPVTGTPSQELLRRLR